VALYWLDVSTDRYVEPALDWTLAYTCHVCALRAAVAQNDPDRTKSVFRGDFYVTGDVARKDDDGYFWFSTRTDDVINSSGYAADRLYL